MTIKPLFCSSNVGVLRPQEYQIPCWDSLTGKFFQFSELLSAFKWSLLCPHSLFYDPSKCLRSSPCLLSVQDTQPQVPSVALTWLPLLTVPITTLYILLFQCGAPKSCHYQIRWSLLFSGLCTIPGSAAKTTVVFEQVHHALSLYSIWTYRELQP